MAAITVGVSLRSGSDQADSATPQLTSSPGPPTVVLLSASGTGDRALPVFSTTVRWQIQYSFDCGNLGRRGMFQILAEPPTDGAVLVNEMGSSVSKIFAADSVPGPHSLLVRSKCGWVVTISQGPYEVPREK